MERYFETGFTVPANSWVDVSYTYKNTYTDYPAVTCDVNGSGYWLTADVQIIGESGCRIRIYNHSNTDVPDRSARIVVIGL